MGVFVNNVRDIGQCRVIIIITIIIITLFTVMKSAIYIMPVRPMLLHRMALVSVRYRPPPPAPWQKNSRTPMIMVDYNRTLLL